MGDRKILTATEMKAEVLRLDSEIARITEQRNHLDGRLKGIKGILRELKTNREV